MIQKTAKIVENTREFTVYQLMRLDPVSGNFIFKLPEFSKHKSLGGLWADLEEVQHESMIEAIKGTAWIIVEVTWSI